MVLEKKVAKLSLKKITLQNLTDAEKANIIIGTNDDNTVMRNSYQLSCSGTQCSSQYCYGDKKGA